MGLLSFTQAQAIEAGDRASLLQGLQAKGEETREGKLDEAEALRLEAVQKSYAALTDRYRDAAR